jgi:beta-lactamase class A
MMTACSVNWTQASLPKIAILLGAFVDIEEGRMDLDSSTRESLTQMVRVSSNQEATRMLNRVGKDHLLDILQSLGRQGIRQVTGLQA